MLPNDCELLQERRLPTQRRGSRFGKPVWKTAPTGGWGSEPPGIYLQHCCLLGLKQSGPMGGTSLGLEEQRCGRWRSVSETATQSLEPLNG